LKIVSAVRHLTRREDERRQHDRDSATKARPAEQRALAVREVEHERRGPHCDGPDHEHEEQGECEARERHRRELVREDEQAEHDEEPDLSDESETFVEPDELAAVARRRAPDGEAHEVHGQEAAAPDHVGRAEGDPDRREGRDWRERADRVGKPGEDPRRRHTKRDTDDEAEP
jgi:hypothetical protein